MKAAIGLVAVILTIAFFSADTAGKIAMGIVGIIILVMAG